MKERQLSITTRLALEIERLWELSPKHGSGLVFGFTNNVKRSFTSARREAGLMDVRFHDLRHTIITELAETSTPDMVIQSIAGHVTKKMLDRYSHIRLAAKRRALEAVEELRDWLNEFDRDSLVFLDYGGLARTIPFGDLVEDHSAREVWEAIVAFEEGDPLPLQLAQTSLQ